MDGLFDKKSDLMKSLEEYFERVKAIKKLPEYQEYLKYRQEFEQFSKFINDKRIKNTKRFIKSIIEDEEKVINWLDRIKNLENKLSDSSFKRNESFSSSNVMDHIWEVAKKYGKHKDGVFSLGKFSIDMYSGQGGYGYAVYINKRIF